MPRYTKTFGCLRHQFNLGMINQRVVIDILLLALTSAPTIDSQDFNLALTLCLDRPPASLLQPNRDDYDDEDDMPTTTDEVALVVPFLQKCWSLLRECRFRDFWQCWKQEEGEGAELIRSQYLPGHRHATSNLRLLIASTIASSFSSISIARLQRWLDFSSAEEAKAFVEGVNGWKVSGDNVAIEGNGDNDVKPSVIKEHVELKRESWSLTTDCVVAHLHVFRTEQDHRRRRCIDE
jgi:translation initiation factor 3 subunit K